MVKIFEYRNNSEELVFRFLCIKFKHNKVKNSRQKLYYNILNCIRNDDHKNAKFYLFKYHKKYGYSNLHLNLTIANFSYDNHLTNDLITKSAKIYKQVVHNVQSNNFQKFISDKKIAIIGNSNFQIGKGTGVEIDSHDICIRFNNYPQGYSEDYGTKCNIWARGYGEEYEIEFKNPLQYNYIIFTGNFLNWDLKEYILDYLYSIYVMNPNALIYSEEVFEDKVQNATSGYILIKYLLQFVPKENIKLYGFSFLDKNGEEDNTHFYDDRCNIVGHSINEERKVLREMFLREGNNYDS